MDKKKGKLYLIPNSLGGENIDLIATPFVKEIINRIDHYVVEKEKPARRYLRKLDIKTPIDKLELYPLNKHTDLSTITEYLDAAKNGSDMGLLSDAGCPGVADPGAQIVSLAHKNGIQVVPLIGPSSILLSLMGSGMNGQEFCFHGYLPREQNDRIKKLRQMEQVVQKVGSSQIFMDTPFRNNHVLEDLIKQCKPTSDLCIAADITMETEFIKTKTIKEWKSQKVNLNKRPCIFILGRRL